MRNCVPVFVAAMSMAACNVQPTGRFGARNDGAPAPRVPDGSLPVLSDEVDRSTEEPEPVAPAAPETTPDGTPERQPCTSSFGAALTRGHGRLDGFLRAVVPPRSPGEPRRCRNDDDHLHLQVEVDGALYDVAVNVQSSRDDNPGDDNRVRLASKETAAPLQWREGWHPSEGLDYVADLAARPSEFTALELETLSTDVETHLETANRISVYADAYGEDGVHNVHRNGDDEDGAIVLSPTESPRWLLFHFASQRF